MGILKKRTNLKIFSLPIGGGMISGRSSEPNITKVMPQLESPLMSRLWVQPLESRLDLSDEGWDKWSQEKLHPPHKQRQRLDKITEDRVSELPQMKHSLYLAVSMKYLHASHTNFPKGQELPAWAVSSLSISQTVTTRGLRREGCCTDTQR